MLAPKAEYDLEYKKTSNKIVSDLPDLNGDGFAEIPTERWKPMNPGEPGGESTALFRTDDNSIPCAMRIEFYNRWPAAGFVYGHCYLRFASKDSTELELMTPVYTAVENGFTINDEPHRELATFRWSDAEKKWIGPAKGPNGIWKLLKP